MTLVDQGSGEELFTHWLLRHLRTIGASLRRVYDAMRRRAPLPAPPAALRMHSQVRGLSRLTGVGGAARSEPQVDGLTVGGPRRDEPSAPEGLGTRR